MNYVPGDVRDQLAYVGGDVVRAGLVVGSGGNLSARLPGDDACWVTASGTWLDRLSRSSFVRVRVADGTVDPPDADYDPDADCDPGGPAAGPGNGDRPSGGSARPSDNPAPAARPTSELALHLATYRARPDVNAIVHLHPQTVLLLDALGERVRLVTTDHAFYLRRVATVPFRPPGSTGLAALAAAAAADGTNCLVLSRHGCSVLGDSVEMAHRRARNLEEAARLTYRALAAGRLDALTGCPDDFGDFLHHLDAAGPPTI